MDSFADYLKPTKLCDFDRSPEIRETARRLTENTSDRREMFNCLYQFVRELPYRLEDWDVKASESLRKGWGMCSGKTNLLIALARALEIPARYRIFKIKPEGKLWRWIAQQDNGLARQMGEPPSEQDHIVAEVYLDDWEVYDPTRDSSFEKGLKKLGIPLERRSLTGNPQLIILDSIDEWAKRRQQARRFRKNRRLILSRMNEQLDKIRDLGRL